MTKAQRDEMRAERRAWRTYSGAPGRTEMEVLLECDAIDERLAIAEYDRRLVAR